MSEDDERGLVQLASHMPDIDRSSAPDSSRPDFIQGITTRGLAQVLRLGEMLRADAGDERHADKNGHASQ